MGSSIPRLTFSGLASGLDSAAIVEALMDVERVPLQRIESERDEVERDQGLFRELNTRLLALRDAARSLDNLTNTLATPSLSEEFLVHQASSADETKLVATATGSASPGVFDVRINQLATVGRRVSVAYADPTTALTAQAGRTVTVDYGGTNPIAIAVEPTTTVADLASAINTDINNDGSVRADLLFDGAQYRLVISATQTGAANDVNVTADFAPFLDAGLTQVATDAQLDVLGVSITRESNQFSDAIPGVSLELRSPHDAALPNEATPVSVTRDDTAITAALQGLVDAYNAVRDFSVEQSSFSEVSGTAGPLSGDALLNSLERRVQTIATSAYVFAGNPFASLSAVGIQFQEDGRLELNADTLASALDQDALSVRELLSGDGTTDGVATAMARELEEVVRPVDGILAERDSSFEDQIKIANTRIDRFEFRLIAREESLVRQFAALESLVSTLRSQTSFIESLQPQRG